jgi:hypothetical protein
VTVATRAAAASEAHVADAARAALEGGNAVDAVVAGVLTAAAHEPSVFLGSLQVLVAGGGTGLIAVDGRHRQPGLDAPRPRGTLDGSAVPAAARVGVPTLASTVAAVLASFGTGSLLKVGRSAVEAAQHVSGERAALLEAFTRRGVPAMQDDAVTSELLAVAGRAAGGQLSPADLGAFRPPIERVDERSFEPPGWLRAPWRDGTADAAGLQVVAAADHGGVLCIACYAIAAEGVAVPRLGLRAPPSAEPVMRGRTRVRPGEPRPAAAPIAIRARKGVAELAIGLAGGGPQDALDGVLQRLDVDAVVSMAVAGVVGRPVAVVRTARAATAAASA